MFTVPDSGNAQSTLQSIAFQSMFDTLVAGDAGTECVLSGCAVTAQGSPNMTVAVAGGTVRSGGFFLSVTGANATITTADATNPRLDLVVIDATGAIQVRAGTPLAYTPGASTPAPPARTAGDVVLAIVYVPATDTTISTNQIVDQRVFSPPRAQGRTSLRMTPSFP